MRSRPMLTTALAAVMCAVLVAAGVPKLPSDPGENAVGSHAMAPLAGTAPLPAAAPPIVAAVASGALRDRIKTATAEAAKSGARISTTVLDRLTHQTMSGNSEALPMASVAKLFIADDLLLREPKLSPEDRRALEVMLRSSDDNAANVFWSRGGGSAIITRVASRYRLGATTPPHDGNWWTTMSTPGDLVRYYDMLLDGSGGLPKDKAGVIINNLAQSTPLGIDGYPQRFGIPDGLGGEQVAVKQGWFCCWNGANQMHLSTGVVGQNRRLVIVIWSLQPTDEATARATITQAVKTMFPGGRVD